MIGPAFLKGDLIEKFREHLQKFNYYHIVHEGISNIECSETGFSFEEVNQVIEDFCSADFPMVCLAGSKSKVPFWDYHVALRFGSDLKEAFIYELLAKEPKEENYLRGMAMAFYILTQNRYGIERIVVPFIIKGCMELDGIFIEPIMEKNISILHKKD